MMIQRLLLLQLLQNISFPFSASFSPLHILRMEWQRSLT